MALSNPVMIMSGDFSPHGTSSPVNTLLRNNSNRTSHPFDTRHNLPLEKPMFSPEYYCQPSSRCSTPSLGEKKTVRRRPRKRQPSCTDSNSSSTTDEQHMKHKNHLGVDEDNSSFTTDDSYSDRMSGTTSPINDNNNNIVFSKLGNSSQENEIFSEVSLPQIEKSENIPSANNTTNDKNAYNSEQFRQEAKQKRLTIQHPKASTAQILASDPGSKDNNNDHKAKTLVIANGKLSETDGEVEIPMGASENQARLIQSKAHIEAALKEKLDKKIDCTDELISGLKECQTKKTTREKVVSATKEVQNAVKPQIVRDPVTSLRTYKVNLNMGQYSNNITHVVKDREVTVTGSTCEEPRFVKEMKVQFPIDCNMEKVNVKVEGEIAVVDVPFKRWSATSNFVGHRERTPETIESIRNVFLGKGSLANAPLYKPLVKKEFMFSRGYGSTCKR